MGRTQDGCNTDVKEIVEAILDGTCTEELVRQLYGLGPEAVILAMMAATRQIASLQAKMDQPAVPADPSTPSGQIPVYAKPNAPKRR